MLTVSWSPLSESDKAKLLETLASDGWQVLMRAVDCEVILLQAEIANVIHRNPPHPAQTEYAPGGQSLKAISKAAVFRAFKDTARWAVDETEKLRTVTQISDA